MQVFTMQVLQNRKKHSHPGSVGVLLLWKGRKVRDLHEGAYVSVRGCASTASRVPLARATSSRNILETILYLIVHEVATGKTSEKVSAEGEVRRNFLRTD